MSAMPIDLTFHDDLKVGTGTYSGTLESTDFAQYLQSWNHERYMSYNELAIIHEVDTAFAELLKHSNQIRGIDLRFEPGRKTALVPAHPSSHHFANFWKAAYESGVAGARELKIFKSLDAARNWVAQSRGEQV